ncbi:MAG: 3'(2'),5'-bisphosphate nucleotidase CysQ [Hyphomicrobium sp.]|nr:3'(2'),5'-bisphosphate nucleotidase CysQ [Hyphomicrobium sp.]
MRAADFDRLAEKLYPAVLDAGLLEMQHFKTGVPIETKSDRSPVTVADREAEAVILAALAQIAPDLPVVAEEAVSAGHIPAPSNEFFLVDALDGTRLFIRGKPEFSVNIGLVQNRRPVFGMIYVPPTGDLFYTAADGRAVRANAPWSLADRIAFSALTRHTLSARTPDRNNLKAFNSQTAGAAGAGLLKALNVKTAEPIGSSLKFCLIAAGEGDLYARLGETSEWDTAAGQAILEAAGGTVTIDGGTALTYGKAAATYRNPHFVAWAREPLIADFGRHHG